MVLSIIGLVVGFVVEIFFILSLQRALKLCSEENRAISPGFLWFILVPVVNLVWNFYVVWMMSKSLDSEFKARGIEEDTNIAKIIGLVYGGLALVAIISAVTFIAQIGSLVCLIVYWVKINGYAKQLSVRPSRLESLPTA